MYMNVQSRETMGLAPKYIESEGRTRVENRGAPSRDTQSDSQSGASNHSATLPTTSHGYCARALSYRVRAR